ncbi:energy transducer TonB [Aliiglaciecola lipolytica]|nr:energy transducer TonB [Aliiglaciecola lipolytica]
MQNVMIQPAQNDFHKIGTSIILAALMTFALFVMMQKLIAQDSDYIAPPETGVFIDPVFNSQDSKTIEQTKIKPIVPPPAMPKTIQPKIEFEPNDSDVISNFTVKVPTQEIVKENQFLAIEDAETTPMIRISPKYPVHAARDGIQGWVKLKFSIDVSGAVKDIEVIDAQPKRTFDREARKALKKWKYKPQIVDGKPVEKTGLEVVLDFKLDT